MSFRSATFIAVIAVSPFGAAAISAHAEARRTIEAMVACMDRSFTELREEPSSARAARQARCLYAARRALADRPDLRHEFESRILRRASPAAIELESQFESVFVWPPKRTAETR